MTDCVTCHKPNPDEAKFCQYCGSAQEKTMAQPVVDAEITCAQCGGKNLPKRKFCAHCGRDLRAAVEQHDEPEPQGTLAEPPPQPAAEAVITPERVAVDDSAAAKAEPQDVPAEPRPQPAAEAVITPERVAVDDSAAAKAEPQDVPAEPRPQPAAEAVMTPERVAVDDSAATDTNGHQQPGSRRWLYIMLALVAGVLVAVAGVFLSSEMLSSTKPKPVASAPAAQKPLAVLPQDLHATARQDGSAPVSPQPAPTKASAPVAIAPAASPEPVKTPEPAAVQHKKHSVTNESSDTPPAVVHKGKQQKPTGERENNQLEKIRHQKALLKQQIDSE
jgi:hypothetical protein